MATRSNSFAVLPRVPCFALQPTRPRARPRCARFCATRCSRAATPAATSRWADELSCVCFRAAKLLAPFGAFLSPRYVHLLMFIFVCAAAVHVDVLHRCAGLRRRRHTEVTVELSNTRLFPVALECSCCVLCVASLPIRFFRSLLCSFIHLRVAMRVAHTTRPRRSCADRVRVRVSSLQCADSAGGGRRVSRRGQRLPGRTQRQKSGSACLLVLAIPCRPCLGWTAPASCDWSL